jgi:hypothetical protein
MITSCKLPSKTGEIVDIALGFDNIEGEIYRFFLNTICMKKKHHFNLIECMHVKK